MDPSTFYIGRDCTPFEGKFLKVLNPRDVKLEARVLIDTPLEEDATYTYIVDQNEKLCAVKVDNVLEIAAKHGFLAYKVNTSRVLVSGECRKTGTNIEFNVLSGTFMQHWMADVLRGECDAAVQARAAAFIQKANPGAVVAYTSKMLVSKESLPVLREHLDKYVDAGYEVRLYSTAKGCFTIPGAVEQTMKIYEKLPPTDKLIVELQEKLRLSKDYTLYAKAGRRKTRRTNGRKSRSTVKAKATYREKFNAKYGYPKGASHSIAEISRLTGYKAAGLYTIVEKGEGAYYSNPESVRTHVTSAREWGVARVYSAVMGGKASVVDRAHLVRM
jgi:hypothetical protein